MGITKLGNQNLSSNSIGSGEVDSGAVDTSKINATITNEDISPSANISVTKVALPVHHHNLFVVMVHLVVLIQLVLMKMHLILVC